MQHQVEITVTWGTEPGQQPGQYRTEYGVRGVSRKHILNKALAIAQSLPCYRDRYDTDFGLEATAKILENNLPIA